MSRRRETITDTTILDSTKQIFANHNPRLFYKPLKDKVRIYCTSCGKYEYISKEKFKQIQKSHICPGCWKDVKFKKHTSTEHLEDCFIKDDTGYYIFYDFKYGSKPKLSGYEVLHFNNTQNVEVRYIKGSMFNYGCFYFDITDCNWRIRKGVADKYRNMSISLEKCGREPISKQQYYLQTLEQLRYPKEKVKSTQRKMMELYSLSAIQLRFMFAFDINNIDDLYRNNGYINAQVKSERYRTEANLEVMYLTNQLNIHYLNYLRKNKINFNNYCDYINQCKQLNFKLDKPKDFEHRHEALSILVEAKKSENLQENIDRRYNRLMNKAYKKGDISIEPFKTNKEIIRCGKVLHKDEGIK